MNTSLIVLNLLFIIFFTLKKFYTSTQRHPDTLQFIHIPKCSGSSVEETYQELNWGRYFHLSTTQKIHSELYRPCSFWHDDEMIPYYFGGFKRFCIIRDPFDRILSEYKYNGLPDNSSVLNKTLAVWQHKVNKDRYFLDNHLCPQSNFAKYCHHILILDKDIDMNLEKLLKSYNLPWKPLMKVNESRQYVNITRDSISPMNKEWIRKIYQKDFEMLNYYNELSE